MTGSYRAANENAVFLAALAGVATSFALLTLSDRGLKFKNRWTVALATVCSAVAFIAAIVAIYVA
jgi:hypothetical protein